MSGPLRKYRFTSPSGVETVVKLDGPDAERHGLTDADLIGAPAVEEKAVTATPNKARSSSQNKARTSRGKGGEGGGG